MPDSSRAKNKQTNRSFKQTKPASKQPKNKQKKMYKLKGKKIESLSKQKQ